ncbi:MAG: glycosyltransferase family 4 protein [Ginsengibacter sp.]
MKFCFFGHIAGSFNGKTIGGAELQIALLARALALKNHEVVIIDPSAEKSFLTEEGVKFVHVPDWNKGINGVRLFMHRIPQLKKLFIEQNADYYYVRMKTYMHLIPYWSARKINKKFIIAFAHDLDAPKFLKNFRYKYRSNFNIFKFLTIYIPNEFAYKFLIKNADYVLLQHSDQENYLENVKGQVLIFPNIFDFSNVPAHSGKTENYFVHPGTLSVLKGIKNLKKLLTVINHSILIKIIGQPINLKSEKIYETLRGRENVTLTGRRNHKETIMEIANSLALINTSNFEGFPNIFLEAWATGVPVISLHVNPGNIFNKYNLGIYCDGDLNKMKKSIEEFHTYPINKEKMVSYVREFHDFSTAGERFILLLTNPKNK